MRLVQYLMFAFFCALFSTNGANAASLTAGEIKQRLSGATVTYFDGRGRPVTDVYEPDGRIQTSVEGHGRQGLQRFDGKWWVDEPDKLCRQQPLRAGGRAMCRKVYNEDGAIFPESRSGGGPGRVQWSITK